MDVSSGTFGEPQPVEITVAGGNAAEFNIEDYLIPLSKINAAALVSVMDAKASWAVSTAITHGQGSDFRTWRLQQHPYVAPRSDGPSSVQRHQGRRLRVGHDRRQDDQDQLSGALVMAAHRGCYGRDACP